jgi:hypothetical protein
MNFLVSDGGESRNHHVETIEPWPSLDDVKSGRTDESESEQRRADKSQVAQGFHAVVGG